MTSLQVRLTDLACCFHAKGAEEIQPLLFFGKRRLQMPVKHHHVDLITRSDIALLVPKHDQPVGLHHGAEHA